MSSTHYRTNNPWVCPILYRQQALGLMVSYPETSRNGTLLTLYSALIAVMLNEAKTSRPRPELRGQDYEVEAEDKVNFWRLRPRLRPKIIMKTVPNND